MAAALKEKQGRQSDKAFQHKERVRLNISQMKKAGLNQPVKQKKPKKLNTEKANSTKSSGQASARGQNSARGRPNSARKSKGSGTPRGGSGGARPSFRK